MSKERLGDRIRGERKRKGYTQEALAKEIGVSRVTLAKVENSEGGVSLDTYIKVCEVLKIGFIQ